VRLTCTVRDQCLTLVYGGTEENKRQPVIRCEHRNVVKFALLTLSVPSYVLIHRDRVTRCFKLNVSISVNRQQKCLTSTYFISINVSQWEENILDIEGYRELHVRSSVICTLYQILLA
jgi:hypothetical protein